jgi:NAD+ synthase
MFDAVNTKDAVVAWIRDFFAQNGPNAKAVIGISGGKDSSVCAALCREALGSDRVYGVLMPEFTQKDIDASFELVRFLDLPHRVVNIGSTVAEVVTSLGGEETLTKQARFNIAPRVRMTVLYAVAASIGGRVANTGNYSEGYIGYSTKFGDAAGDFGALARLTATEVVALGHALNLPKNLVEKTPADGLTGKTDEDNFGFSYKVLDAYIRTGICGDQAVKEKIDRMHKANLHKSLAMPVYTMNSE